MTTRMFVLYIHTCDLISDISCRLKLRRGQTQCIWQNQDDKQKTDKIWKSNFFLHKSPSNRWFKHGIHIW